MNFGVNIMRKTEEYNITFSDDNQVVKKQRVKKDKMNVFEVFGYKSACFRHMAGKPLN